MVPLLVPLALPVIVSQLPELVAVQAQPLPAVTPTRQVAAVVPIVRDAGDSAEVQGADCVTVKVAVPAVSVADRDDVALLADSL
jgi:hypothetical protein